MKRCTKELHLKGDQINLIESLARIARGWVEENLDPHFPDLCGTCAWASAFILKKFEKHGIEAKALVSKFDGGNHVFVVTRQYLIDVTATQFDVYTDDLFYDPVIIAKKNKPKPFFWKNIIAELTTAEDLVRYTIRKKWPLDQIPNLIMMEETHDI